tara:strand:- start:57 stop:161 length:105 start_codon:yes stop_codon:yes gene_type:complete
MSIENSGKNGKRRETRLTAETQKAPRTRKEKQEY